LNLKNDELKYSSVSLTALVVAPSADSRVTIASANCFDKRANERAEHPRLDFMCVKQLD
jgi:hypothetical protein